MKRSAVILFFLFMLGGLAKGQYLTGPNGVKYFFWRQSLRLAHAHEKDLVFVHMVGRNDHDSIILSSYVQGDPFQIFVPKPTYHGCFYEMLTLMAEGDSAEVQVVADSLFERSFGSPLPDFVAPGSKMKLTLKLISIVTRDEYDKRMAEEAKYADVNQTEDINKFIAENKLQMTRTDAGLYYQFLLKGFARRAIEGDSVVVHYTGYFLDGRVFDSSLSRNMPYTFRVGTDAILQGWNEALKLMSIRDKLMVIIPYQLAYGEKGNNTIPPFTPIVFELELLNIK